MLFVHHDLPMQGAGVACAHGLDVGRSGRILADGYGDVAQDSSKEGRGNTETTYGFLLFSHVEDCFFHISVNPTGWAIKGVAGKIFCRSQTARDHQGIVVVGLKLCQIENIASGDPGRLDQYVSLLVHLLAVEVIEDVVLRDVRGVALVLSTVFVDGPEGKRCFMDLSSVLMAAAGEDDCNGFSAHGDSSGVEVIDLGKIAVFFIKIQAVANEKSLRNGKAEIVNGDLMLTTFSLVDEGADTDRGSSLV